MGERKVNFVLVLDDAESGAEQVVERQSVAERHSVMDTRGQLLRRIQMLSKAEEERRSGGRLTMKSDVRCSFQAEWVSRAPLLW